MGMQGMLVVRIEKHIKFSFTILHYILFVNFFHFVLVFLAGLIFSVILGVVLFELFYMSMYFS